MTAGYETNTMPGWAGSSWYFLRYMDPHNSEAFASPEAVKYWGQVDMYVGGAEHATGHLLYSRFWNMALHDLNYDCKPYGLESDVNEQLAGEHPLLESVRAETERVATAVHLQQELRVVMGKIFTSGTYNASNVVSLASGYQWNGGASANPIRNMNAAIAAMPVPPTHLVMSLPVMHAITENDDLRAILSANHEGLFTADELALYWGIEEAVVNNGQYAAASDPSTMTRILSSTDLALIHANPDKMMRTFLRQYRLRQGARGFVSTARYDGGEAGVAGYTFPKVAHQTDVVTVDDTYGYLLQNVKRS